MSISFSQLHFADPSLPARRLFWHVLSIGQVWRDEPERHADRLGASLEHSSDLRENIRVNQECC
jgi:hypothetical protein